MEGDDAGSFCAEAGLDRGPNELIKGKRGITAVAALDLADALGTSPKIWMNLQATFDLDKALKTRQVARRPISSEHGAGCHWIRK